MNNTPQRLRASLLGGALFLSGALISAPTFAQDPQSSEQHSEQDETSDLVTATDEKSSKRFAEWDVLKPPFPLHTVNIKSDEVTWASLDVTPDGKTHCI